MLHLATFLLLLLTNTASSQPTASNHIPRRPIREQIGHSLEQGAASNQTTSFNQTEPSNQTASSNQTAPAQSGYRSAVYFPNWDIYGRNFQPQNLTASLFTHVIYAFANIESTGEVVLSDTYADLEKHYPNDSWSEPGNNVYGCVKQLYLLKKQNRNMKTLLSIGGWTYSPSFAAPMATEAGRTLFAQSAVEFVKDLGFDGIDIDWEYPANEDQAQNMVQLLTSVKAALQNYSSYVPGNPHFLLTVASPAGPANYQQLDIAGMDAQLDFWNLMAYDYAGSWDMVSGDMSNVYASSSNTNSTPFNTDQAIAYYTSHGVDPSRINLGLPTYGRSFESTAGLGLPFSGVGSGSWEDGVWDNKALPRPGAQVFFNEATISTWSYDNSTQELISYDDVKTATAKMGYIQKRELGGGMWWEASSDYPVDSGKSVVQVVVQGLGGSDGSGMEQSQNVLDYPLSVYDNIKNGMNETGG